MNELKPFAPQTPYAVGRKAELQALANALTDPSDKSALLYFVGAGGIGKTRLVEEAVKYAPPTMLVSPLIDLYHAEAHSVSGLEYLLVQGLDPQMQHFAAYRARIVEIEKQRAGGVKTTPKEQEALTQTFLQDYAALAVCQRLCLRFDTTELIQRESDRVQQLCQIETSYLEIRDWLLQVLPQLPNTVILLAGRPAAPLRDELTMLVASQANTSFQRFQLEGLSTTACHEYLAALREQAPSLQDIPVEAWELAWKYSKGHPIRLSLIIDLVLNGRNIAELFPPHHDPTATTLPIANIDSYLIEQLLDTPEPTRTLFVYLALARKGLDAALLHHLEPTWSLEACAAQLDSLRRFTFIKQHPGTAQLFIHDELYTLLDRYLLRERRDYVRIYRSIHAYYTQLLKTEPGSAPLLKPDALYYALQIDPWGGFWGTYLPWAEEAVRAGDSALDMRLRDALLHFLRDTAEDPWVTRRLPPELLERDAAVRWCRRYLEQGNRQRTLEIAQRIKESPLLDGDPLYSAALSVVRAEAALYTSSEIQVEVTAELQTAISTLETWSPESESDPQQWWRVRLLGRAHNNLGYYYWVLGQNQRAIDEYKHAIRHFHQANIKDEHAATLTNLGFIYVQLGLMVEADAELKAAIKLRKDGPRLPLALSLNTQGLAYTHSDRPAHGIRRCEEALRIFEDLHHLRGQGLAHLALGLGYRKRAEEWKEDLCTLEEAEGFFEIAGAHLEKAKDIFQGAAAEPVRLWEAHNELGSLYCDWGWWLLAQARTDAANEKYKLAIQHLKTSIEVALQEPHLQHQLADSYDDLSQVYGDMGDLPLCEQTVERVLKVIPDVYLLTPGQGFENTPEYPVEAWWQLLGKAHLGKAVRLIKRAVDQNNETALSAEDRDWLLDEAAKDYACAVAYFYQYSPHSIHLNRTFMSIKGRMETLDARTLDHMHQVIWRFGEDHKVNLDRLLLLIENTMGLERDFPT